MCRALSRAAVVLLLAAACATPSQPFQGHPVLAAIRFEGNASLSSGELLDKIATTPTGGFFSRTARYYDADLFALDLRRIVRWYNQKGFYEAKVEGVREERDDQGRVTVVVKIEEGRRAQVKKQDLEGLEELSKGEIEDLDDALPMHPGDLFDEDVYEKAKSVLLERLRERGFAQAEVNGRVEVAPEEGAAHVIFDADTGPRFQFGEVVVSGNQRIPAEEIIRATGIEKGDRYRPQALALAQQRVYNLGTFSGVRVAPELSPDAPVATVRVNVREAPFQTVRFGIGGTAEEARWELPRLRGEYTNRSLFGGLRRLELESTAGYAFVDSPFSYDPARSGLTTRSSAQLIVPNVLFPGLDFITRGEFAREVQAGFAYDDVAARVSLLYRRGSHAISPSLNFVRFFEVDLRGTELLKILNVSGSGAGIVNECPVSCTLTYPELRYTYDGRDNAIEPTRGFYATISLQQTLEPGSFNDFRITPAARADLPFTKYAVIALLAEDGGLVTEAGSPSPFTQRFFFGGQNEQRGYSPLRQGPKLGAQPVCGRFTIPGTPTCGAGQTPYATVAVPVGGTHAVLFSAELRLKADFILRHLGIVPFIDASRVQNATNPLEGGLEFAPGLGLRYLTAFGPIRLDVAWVANPKDVFTNEVRVTDKSGQPITVVAPTRVSTSCSSGDPTCIRESRWAFHVTLGEAF